MNFDSQHVRHLFENSSYSWAKTRGQDVDLNAGRPSLTLLKGGSYNAFSVGKNWQTGKFFSTASGITGQSSNGETLYFNSKKVEFSSFDQLSKFVDSIKLPSIKSFKGWLTTDDAIDVKIKTWTTWIQAVPLDVLSALKADSRSANEFLSNLKRSFRTLGPSDKIVNSDELISWFEKN